MGLFKRKADPDAELAKALATRGVPGRATVVSMRETGETRGDGVAKEIEFELDLTVDGAKVRTRHRQFMNRFTLHAVAPGEPVRVIYDREDPQRLMVEGHVRFRTDVVANEIVVIEVEDVASS